MTKRTLLKKSDLSEVLKTLPGWKVVKGKLHKEYEFDSFIRAFSFMTATAITAEAMNHHPEWFNVYNKVTVDLVTHDLGGISTFDVVLASKMERIAGTI